MTHNCRVCGDLLVVGENAAQYRIDNHEYICQNCNRKQWSSWNHRAGRCQPMNKNRECTHFLGIHVAEEMLSYVFKKVYRMPFGNPGYDFICGRAYRIDVKSSCRGHDSPHSDRWKFAINKNLIAEYFLCLAFDNRHDLNPEHIWLIPSETINDKIGVGISESRLEKWKEYELPIDKVISCCDSMKEASK